MDWAAWKPSLECLQIVVEALAIIVAGVWAVIGLIAFRRRERAVADLRKVEIETRQIELAMRRAAALDVAIEVETTAAEPTGSYCLAVMVSLHNCGNRDTRVQWEGEPAALVVRRVAFADGGVPVFAEPIELRVSMTRDPAASARSHVIRAGATERLAFAARVPGVGLYLLSFRGAVDPKERSAATELGVEWPTAWTAAKYVSVQPARPPGPE